MSASDGAAMSPLTGAPPPLLLKRQRYADRIASILETAKAIGTALRDHGEWSFGSDDRALG